PLRDWALTSALLIWFSGGILSGVLCDIVFIALTRKLLRWLAGALSSIRILLILILNFSLAFAFFVGPILLNPLIDTERLHMWSWLPWLFPSTFGHGDSKRDTLAFVILIGQSNLIGFIISLVFIALTVALLLHRVIWPMLDRPIYSLQRLGIARRSKL